MNLSQCEPFK